MRKAKILATLGPASNTPEKIEMMIESGISAVRINMSHGTQEEHTAAIANARAAATKLKRALSVLVDLSGPKIRTRTLKDKMPVELKVGELFTITTREIEGNQFEVATNFDHLPEVVEPGTRILVDDGVSDVATAPDSDMRKALATFPRFRLVVIGAH